MADGSSRGAAGAQEVRGYTEDGNMEAPPETAAHTSWAPSSGAAEASQPKRHILTEQLLEECERRRREVAQAEEQSKSQTNTSPPSTAISPGPASTAQTAPQSPIPKPHPPDHPYWQQNPHPLCPGNCPYAHCVAGYYGHFAYAYDPQHYSAYAQPPASADRKSSKARRDMENSASDGEGETAGSAGRMFQCEFANCRRSYSTAHSRRQHYRRHHRPQWTAMKATKGSVSPSTSNPNSGPGSPYPKGRNRTEDSPALVKQDLPNGAFHAHYLTYPPGAAQAVPMYPQDPHALPQVSHVIPQPSAPTPTNLPGSTLTPTPASTLHPTQATPAAEHSISAISVDGLESGPDEALAASALVKSEDSGSGAAPAAMPDKSEASDVRAVGVAAAV